MIERTQDIVTIRRTREDLKEVLQDALKMLAEAQKDVTIPPDLPLTQSQEDELAAALAKLAKSDANAAEGTTSAMISGVHFPLKKSLFGALIVTVSLTGSVVALIINPVGGAVALSSTVLLAAERAATLLTPLDANEITVYEALATLMHQKKRDGIAKTESTRAEIAAALGIEPEEVEPLLVTLRDKKVIKFRAAAGDFEYWIEV